MDAIFCWEYPKKEINTKKYIFKKLLSISNHNYSNWLLSIINKVNVF